jgi:hypothetical protein
MQGEDAMLKSALSWGGRPTHLALLPIVLLAALIFGGCGNSSSSSLIALSNGQAAAVAIGQADFDSNALINPPAADTLAWPWGDPVVVNGALYLGDTGNMRVLRYDRVPRSNQPVADLVLGQIAFDARLGGTGADGMASSSKSVSAGSGKLAVWDSQNNRIMIWNSEPSADGQAADVVVGQTGWGLFASACSASSLSGPTSGVIAGDKLLSVDASNNRVLIWDTIPTSPGEPANLVLGQTSFTQCAANDTNRDGTPEATPDASTLFDPNDVWSDGTRVIVADRDNQRLLIWNTFPTTDGQAADLVLGQGAMNTNATATSQTGLYNPSMVTSNGTQIFVAEESNNRVLVWDAWPTMDGAPADVVLGQAGFDTSSFGVGAAALDTPGGLHAADGRLFVVDNGNNRVLIFKGH